MAKNDNLTDFLTDLSLKIQDSLVGEGEPTPAPIEINPQYFSYLISSLKPVSRYTTELDMSSQSGEQYILTGTGKTMQLAVVNKPATMIPANIKKDVNIGGIVGTLESGITPSGNINITSTSQVDVTNYATARVVDSDLVASNIKSGVNILGVVGTFEGGSTNKYKQLIERTATSYTASDFAGITKIGSYSFSNYDNLTSIELPNTITQLGDLCFYYCDRLTSFTIPSSVTRIGQRVFASCTRMQNLYVYTTSSSFKADIWIYGWVNNAPNIVLHAKSSLNASSSKVAFGDYWNYNTTGSMNTTIYDL